MKSNYFLGIILLSVAPASWLGAQAETVSWNQVPQVVQRVINEQRGPVGVAAIQRVDRFGAPTYEVRLSTPGPDTRFYVTEAGTIISADEARRPAVNETREMTFAALPIAVQNTIRAKVGNAVIQTIELITGNGQTTYLVPYRIGNEIQDLWIQPNGTVLAASPSRVLLSSPRRINYGDLPSAVREQLEVLAGGRELESVRQGKARGQTVYEVTLHDQGHKVELRFGESGSLIRDSVNDRYLAETGRLPAPAVALGASVPARVPMTESTPMSFNQLPLSVSSAIQKYAGANFVEKIDKGIAQGQAVYQAVFRHAGETIPLRITETGALVNDGVNNWALARLEEPLSARQDDWRSAAPRATLSDVRLMDFDQLPIAVQDTLRYFAGGVAGIHHLVHGMANGESVYQADVGWRGEDVQLRIAEDGSLIDDKVDALFLSQFRQALGVPASVGQAPALQSGAGSGRGLRP